jgi:WS/DGAT/MGAT family acyltransferase
VGALVRLLTLPEDNPQCFRERLSGHRVVGWNRERPFEPIRQFAKASNLKINDIFLAALAGAFREYLHSVYGAIGEQQNLRVSIPVNLRAGDPCDLGNHFGLVMLDLPVGVADRQSRLEIVAQRMQELKHSPLARAVLASLAAAGHMPAAMEKRLVSYLGAKTATIVSNLPGPKEALRLAGGRLSKLVFWPPQSGGVGIGISMLSYAGNVTVGVSADIHLVPDPQLLLAAFDAELDALLGVPATVEDRPLPREEVAAST